jgi:hypothetical protein
MQIARSSANTSHAEQQELCIRRDQTLTGQSSENAAHPFKKLKVAHGGPTELHKAAGVNPPHGRSNTGPTPTQEIRLLQTLQNNGISCLTLLDQVAKARADAAVAEATSSTYASHVRMIEWACSILGESPMPASAQLIGRVATLVNNPSTQRGWLAAWRDLHVRERIPWVGDQDLYLRKIRKGTSRLAPEPPPRSRLRLHWWRRLLCYAAQKGLIEFGTTCNLAYVFAARVPSELLRQLCWDKLSIEDNRLTYSDVARKGKPRPCTLTRWCVCQKAEIMCWHPWLAALRELKGDNGGKDRKLLSMSTIKFTNMLRESLVQCGMPHEKATTFTTHCFRRGAGTDVLEAEDTACSLLAGKQWKASSAYGLTGMLRMGDWSTRQSAQPYASHDEQQAASLAFEILEASDEEWW